MKKLFCFLLLAGVGWAQPAPDCQFTKTFSNTTPAAAFNNKPTPSTGVACNAWVVTYWTNGATGVSVQIEGAPDVSGSPGSYTALTAATSPITSANPSTAIANGIILACCDYYPWIRINPTVFTGTNKSMTVRVYGWKSPTQVAGGGGGGGGGGAVNSVAAGNFDPVFTTTVTNPTSTPLIQFAVKSTSQNFVFAGPASGGPGNWVARALVAADIPAVAPSGTAGGDLSGTYPNPTVAQVNGAVVPTSAAVAATNSSKQITAASLPNGDAWVGNGSNVPTATAASTTVNSQSCALGSSCTVTAAPSGSAGGDLSGTYPNPTVAQVNGAVVPTSAAVAGTNSSKQITAASGHGLAAIRTCPDSTGSGTVQSCSTAVSFAPATGDEIIYTTTTQNSGALTIAVNGASAASVYKWGGSTPVVSGDVAANKPFALKFDSAGHWDIDDIANIPASSAGSSNAVQASNGLGGFLDTGCTASSGAEVCSGGFSTGGPFSISAIYVNGGGTANAQTVSLSASISSLATGLTFCFLPSANNTTAAPTITVTGGSTFAAKPTTKYGTTALIAGDWTTSAVACVIYDGTEFQLQNPQTPPGSTPTGSAGGSLGGTYPNPSIASSVSLPGSPTTTTQGAGDNSTKIATTAYVDGLATAASLTSIHSIAVPTAAGSAVFAQRIASGTCALHTASIASPGHDVTTCAATGVLSTDAIIASVNGSIIAVTGYVPSTSGTLGIYCYPTAGNINCDAVNNVSTAQTPGPVTINYVVVR